MGRFEITGKKVVSGVHRVPGNENAALPMIAAALLTSEPVTLENVPDIADVASMLECARSFGASVTATENIIMAAALADEWPHEETFIEGALDTSGEAENGIGPNAMRCVYVHEGGYVLAGPCTVQSLTRSGNFTVTIR
jgi:UDP-N-acetylglucosamine enolpyruvyl transferase